MRVVVVCQILGAGWSCFNLSVYWYRANSPFGAIWSSALPFGAVHLKFFNQKMLLIGDPHHT